MMKRWFRPFLWIVILLISFGCSSGSSSVMAISLDFPHGGLRLLVQPEGEAHLFYGELPASRVIQEDAFDIEQLYKQLQPRLHENVPAEARPLGQPFGMVTIHFTDGSSRDYLIYDEEFAGELLRIACQHKIDEEDSATAIFEKECANL